MHYLYVMIVCVCLMACRHNNEGQTAMENITEIPEDFVGFYERFHSDSAFQMQHIVFPLDKAQDGGKWQKDGWVLHKPFNAMQGGFTREFDNLHGIIIETMKDKTGTVTIERRFSKMSGEYRLIYYAVESKFGQ